MALSYKTRRRLALIILLIGLPAYVVIAVTLVNLAARLFGRPPFLLELAVYVGLGIAWVLPLRPVFLGIGQADPDAGAAEERDGGPEEGEGRNGGH